MTQPKVTIDEVVGDFSQAEEALRTLVEQAREFEAAGQRLDVARGSVDLAAGDLSKARDSVDGSARSLVAVAEEFQGLLVQVTTAAAGLNQLEPEALRTGIDTTSERLGSLVERLSSIASSVDEVSSRTKELVASVAEARASLGSITTHVSAESGEIRSAVRRVANDVDSFKDKVVALERQQDELASRSRLLLILVAITAALAAAGVVIQLVG